MRRSILLGLGVALAASTAVVATMPQSSDVQNRLDEVRQELRQVKGDMDRMNCCIDPGCNFCPLAAGQCPCGMNVKTDVGVCGECYDGWRAGQGWVSGIAPEDVKHLQSDTVRQIYEMRAKHFGEGSE